MKDALMFLMFLLVMAAGFVKFGLWMEHEGDDPGLWVHLRVALASADRLKKAQKKMQRSMDDAETGSAQERVARRFVEIISGTLDRRETWRARRRARRIFSGEEA